MITNNFFIKMVSDPTNGGGTSQANSNPQPPVDPNAWKKVYSPHSLAQIESKEERREAAIVLFQPHRTTQALAKIASNLGTTADNLARAEHLVGEFSAVAKSTGAAAYEVDYVTLLEAYELPADSRGMEDEIVDLGERIKNYLLFVKQENGSSSERKILTNRFGEDMTSFDEVTVVKMLLKAKSKEGSKNRKLDFAQIAEQIVSNPFEYLPSKDQDHFEQVIKSFDETARAKNPHDVLSDKAYKPLITAVNEGGYRFGKSQVVIDESIAYKLLNRYVQKISAALEGDAKVTLSLETAIADIIANPLQFGLKKFVKEAKEQG